MDHISLNKLSFVEPKGPYHRRYSGAVLFDARHNIILQSRDQKPSIINAGKLTLFGGSQNPNETPIQCMIRELREELDLAITAGRLRLLGYIDKREADGTTTRCSIYTLKNVKTASLHLREGRAIVVESPNALLSNPLVSEVTKISIQACSKHT